MDQDYLIQKWLANELTEKEAKAFDSLDDSRFYEEIIRGASAFKASEFSAVVDFDSFKARYSERTKTAKRLPRVLPLMRIAAVLVLGFALYYFFLFDASEEFRTGVGETFAVELPDDSRIILNAMSEISFNKKMWDKNREVLLEGEAFFDVATGGQFKVVTTAGTVSVLGTEFNVKQRGSFFEVKCFEGRVQVSSAGKTRILGAGENFLVYGETTRMGRNTHPGPQWNQKISSFDRIPVSEVFAELERQYRIEIDLEGVEKDQLFTGAFVHDDLENALESLAGPLDLEYYMMQDNKVRVRPREK